VSLLIHVVYLDGAQCMPRYESLSMPNTSEKREVYL